MPEQWTGELIGKMHNAGISKKEFAAFMGKNAKYLSQVLNGHRNPKRAEQEYNAALTKMISLKYQHTHNTTEKDQ